MGNACSALNTSNASLTPAVFPSQVTSCNQIYMKQIETPPPRTEIQVAMS